MSQVWLNVKSLEIRNSNFWLKWRLHRGLRNRSHHHLQNIQNYTHLDDHIPPTYSFSCCISSLPFICTINIVVHFVQKPWIKINVFYVPVLCCFETRFTNLVRQTSTTGRNSYPAKGRTGTESLLDHESKCYKVLNVIWTTHFVGNLGCNH